ncbi:MAG: NADH-quinone oxidoreductase subunit F, partial [Clostridia bacterium]|nr:NADH-quinone oxidoreductase subunit F [Clostridia bacterium]
MQIKACLEAEIDEAKQGWPVLEGGCLGHCYAEPLVLVHNPGFPDLLYGFVNKGLARRLIKDYLLEGDPCLEYLLAAVEENELGLPSLQDFPRGQLEKRILLARCGRIDPGEIRQALAKGAYAALASALEQKPEDLLNLAAKSGLRGRGGAGFPAARKWQVCRQTQAAERYLICNADEGDPGAFMDRSLLESDPHLLLEGMLLAAYIIGAKTGFIYVRAEYPLAVARLQTALQQAQELNLLGENILGSNFSFKLQIFQGAGAFVCGEETALLASMQGYAGLPSPRPPHPAEAGYLGQPTVINNVKTLCFLPSVLAGNKPDTLLLALAGQIPNPGLLEVPLGTSLSEIIKIGGSGQDCKAVQLGGPSGSCLSRELLSLPLDYETLQTTGAIMGSGGVIVLNQQDCMVETARYFMGFTQQDSCGKCSFYRLGTQQMLNILTRIVQGEG